MQVGAVILQTSGLFELLVAHVALMPPDVDAAHVGVVALQISGMSH